MTHHYQWIHGVGEQPNARLRLFCFPFAGSGASAYFPWRSHVPDFIELCPIQLPGREECSREPLIHDVDALVEHIITHLKPYLDKPFAFYGHSMGAGLALRVTQALEEQGLATPQHLFLAVHRAPSKPYSYPSVKGLPDGKLAEVVQYFGGIPDSIIQNPAFVEHYVPIIHNDLIVCEDNLFASSHPVSCPITLFIGKQDHLVAPEDYDGWEKETRAYIRKITIDHGHFFVKPCAEEILSHISHSL